MNKKRLLKLADLLDADAKKKNGIKFDLNSFAKPADHEHPVGWYEKKPRTIPVDCGTAGCALGLAAISGAFKRSGFTFALCRSPFWCGRQLVPKFGQKLNFDAAQAFFGISEDECTVLFSADSYSEKNQTGARAERLVARRIRALVAGRKLPAAN